MNEKKWVQSIYSDQGEKWELHPNQGHEFVWEVHLPESQMKHGHAYLPKSEYIPCPPPERWVDVTEECLECELSEFAGGIKSKDHDVLFQRNKLHGEPYRLRKVQLFTGDTRWAFIIEQKEPS